jgi:hypothetical protein
VSGEAAHSRRRSSRTSAKSASRVSETIILDDGFHERVADASRVRDRPVRSGRWCFWAFHGVSQGEQGDREIKRTRVNAGEHPPPVGMRLAGVIHSPPRPLGLVKNTHPPSLRVSSSTRLYNRDGRVVVCCWTISAASGKLADELQPRPPSDITDNNSWVHLNGDNSLSLTSKRLTIRKIPLSRQRLSEYVNGRRV